MIQKQRNTYIDFLRILAAFLVIFNHLPGYTLYQIAGGVKGWIYTFITMFTRINVPIFLMISGALLLGKQESLSVILKKRVLRIVLVLILFSALTYTVSEYPVIRFHPKEFVQKLLTGSVATPYWYLYAYLSFLILLPYIRKIAAGFAHKDFVYLLVIRTVLLGIIPALNYFSKLYFSFPLRITSDLKVLFMTERIFFYPLVGYYLDQVLDIKKVKCRHLLGLAAAAMLGIVISSVITIHQGTNGKFTQDYVMLFDYIIAISTFVFVKYIFTRKPSAAKVNFIDRVICFVGPLTMGIYLLDQVWKELLYSRFNNLLEPLMPTMIFSFCWCIFSMTLSGSITFILKKVPGVKKLL